MTQKGNKKVIVMSGQDTKVVAVRYTNWKGETSLRNIEPIEIFFGSNEFHPESQWLLRCFDADKKAERTFAMKDIHEWSES